MDLGVVNSFVPGGGAKLQKKPVFTNHHFRLSCLFITRTRQLIIRTIHRSHSLIPSQCVYIYIYIYAVTVFYSYLVETIIMGVNLMHLRSMGSSNTLAASK